MRVIKGGKKAKTKQADELEHISCPACGECVFQEVIVNPMSRNGKWDKRTGSKMLRCGNSACRKILNV